MKISKLECITLLLTAVFLSFAVGWFFRGSTQARPIQVETARTLAPAENTPVALPAPTQQQVVQININAADVEALATLPGIGEKRAEDIVAYRTTHGPFRIAEDITKVPGIGESTMTGLLALICVDEGQGDTNGSSD